MKKELKTEILRAFKIHFDLHFYFIKHFVWGIVEVIGGLAAFFMLPLFLLGSILWNDLTFVQYCTEFANLFKIFFADHPIFFGLICFGIPYSYFYPKSFFREILRTAKEFGKEMLENQPSEE